MGKNVLLLGNIVTINGNDVVYHTAFFPIHSGIYNGYCYIDGFTDESFDVRWCRAVFIA